MPALRKLTADERRTVVHWCMELVVVVVGVLIALGLQERVQQQQARRDMRAAEDAIHDEVRSALTSLMWRQAISKCHFERAQILKSMLLTHGSQWPGLNENTLVVTPPKEMQNIGNVVPSVYQRPIDNFTNAAWTSALTTGALAPMDRHRFGLMVALYDQIRLLIQMREREDDAASRLSALAFPQELTPEVRTQMLQALYEIDRTRFMFALSGPAKFAGWMRELGWNDRREVDRWIAEDQAEGRRQAIPWRPCVAYPQNPFAKP